MMQKLIPAQFRISYYNKLFFSAILQFTVLYTHAQYHEVKPEPEIGMGIKIIKGKIIYGPKPFYVTDNRSIGLQALFRYDAPVKISSLSPYQKRYINFVVESGFIFCKANVFDSTFIDPSTNTISHEKSKNATYFPVYIGLYSRSTFSIGAEVFYWKGLGAQDLWGAKFLSLAYNAQNFRISCSGEWYAQTKTIKNSGILLSIDFLWKLVIKD